MVVVIVVAMASYTISKRSYLFIICQIDDISVTLINVFVIIEIMNLNLTF